MNPQMSMMPGYDPNDVRLIPFGGFYGFRPWGWGFGFGYPFFGGFGPWGFGGFGFPFFI